MQYLPVRLFIQAGIATEDNLKLLREKMFGYMCVSRSNMKKYSVDTGSQPITIFAKKGQALTLQKVTVEGSTDTWLRVHSQAKALKESGMNRRFSQRFEEGLTQIKEIIGKKNGIKKQEKIIIRLCSEPTDQANKIYTALKYKSKPFSRKKSEVPTKPDLFSD